ncbi:ASE1 [Candida theae]|uniref:ASE1 n=1 Tax=Candida theae TaxID=1198502 RepID=A0AAD5B9U0_9ASCO|nr:ASE1 [Candida theae]KAI5948948.1 ASE1 [Candida theae]
MSFYGNNCHSGSPNQSSFLHDLSSRSQTLMPPIQSTPKPRTHIDQTSTRCLKHSSRSPIKEEKEEEFILSSSTLTTDDQSRLNHNQSQLDDDVNTRFDSIELKINNAISELESIYKIIGYSSSEVNSKKSEIFTIVQDTISNFANSLQRKKSTLENECEWLKQQIQVILSMVNDAKGDKSLSLLQRGLVFNNQQQYVDGYKEQILSKMSSPEFKRSKLGDELTVEQQDEYMVRNIPELTLLELRSRLNMIFIEVLKTFVKQYKQYNSLNIECAKIVASIGPSEFDSRIIGSMPTLSDAESHQKIMEEFISLVTTVNTNQTPDQSENEVFIIASPVKSSSRETIHSSGEHSEDNMSRLRQVNYQLVRVMRSLKFTRISSDLMQALQQEIRKGRESLDARRGTVVEIVNKCLECIEFLQYSDEHLADLQKNEIGDSEGCLDSETLKLLLRDPLEFGLHDEHINYLVQFQNLIQAKIDEKREKWESYSTSCMQLWKRLGESEEYIGKFMQNNNNLSDLSLLNFKMELNRLYIKRSEYIESFISDARAEIERLWDQMYYSKDMRSEFEYFQYDPEFDDRDKESVLNIHEEEVKKLQQELEQKQPVLQIYAELQDLIKDQKFLQESSQDSSRLLSKNSCKILLNEEKIRKRINKSMPRVIESLKSEVKKYNNRVVLEGQRPLMINDKDFFEEVLRLESEHLSSGNRVKQKSASTSPMKRPVSASNISPERKQQPRFMSTRFPQAPRSTGRAKVSKLSTNPRQTVATRQPSPVHTSNVSSATKSSLGSSSSSRVNSSLLTLESPVSTSCTNSFIAKPPSVELKPLTSPLKSSTTRGNTSTNSYTNKITVGPQFHFDSREEKENKLGSFVNKVSNLNQFPPVNIEPASISSCNGMSSAGSTSIGNDTSTMMGDDYFAWRDEKIKQLNDV